MRWSCRDCWRPSSLDSGAEAGDAGERDLDNVSTETEENFFEVSGGKVVSEAALIIVLGSVANRLSKEKAGENIISPPQTSGGATGASGRRGNPLEQPEFQTSRNKSATINGRIFSGHALDQIQIRGLTPTVVENTIKPKNQVGKADANGVRVFEDKTNGVRAVVNKEGNIITVITIGRE